MRDKHIAKRRVALTFWTIAYDTSDKHFTYFERKGLTIDYMVLDKPFG